MTSIDEFIIEEYLDNALIHSDKNEWAEGYWIGRAVQHAHQNAIDYEWLVGRFEVRGLDAAVVAVSKLGDVDPRNN